MMKTGTSKQVRDLLESSWAQKTKVGYKTQLNKWKVYCQSHNIDPHQASYDEAVEFLGELFTQGANYSTVATARSALSAVLPQRMGITFGQYPLTTRVLKGVFKQRPSLPKHTGIYDTNIILDYMKVLPENKLLSLELLTLKLVTLLCLLSGQRAQTLPCLSLKHMIMGTGQVTFHIRDLLKTSRPTFHQLPLIFKMFPANRDLCPISCLETYLEMTKSFRLLEDGIDRTQLILSFAGNHNPVKSATIARYIKSFLGKAGVDITVFTAHSVRKASTSKGNNMGLSVKDIAKAAGWSGESTFQRFYNLPIVVNLGSEILQSNVSGTTMDV